MAEEKIEIKEVYWAAVSKKSVWYDCEWQPKAYNQPHYFIGSGWGSNGTYYKAWYSCIEVDLPGQQSSDTEKYLKIILHSDPKSGVWIPENDILIAAGLSKISPNRRNTNLPTSFINDIYFLKNSEGETLSNKQGTEETGIIYLKIPSEETLKKYYIYLFSANEADGKPATSDYLWWRGYCETTKYRQGIEAYLTDSISFDDDPDTPDTPDTPDDSEDSLSISLFYQNDWKKASPFIYHNETWHEVKDAWIYQGNKWKQIKKE